ncbi:predicted protein [Nematostella vectensis]|uniref:Uncharacterized protein n=1 Tax=Nematostella vectensis TaxID=45351 RepID=A7RX44_NEMVE|nr:predicted protein [Nematostella vectensis]|eukprot:XP_001636029.1 predicted protein [Nematostella vectensis]
MEKVVKQQPPPRKLQTEKIYAFTETTAVESQPTFEEDRPKPGKLVGKWQPEESTVERAIIKPGKLTNIEFGETELDGKEVVKQQPPPRKLQTEKIYAFTETTAVESQPTFEEDRPKPGKLVGKWQPEESTVERAIIKPGKLTNIEFIETEPEEKEVVKQQPPPRKLQTEKIYAFTETTAVESQPTFEEDRPKPGKLVGKWQPEESTVEKAIIKPGKLTNIEFIETEPEEKEVVKQQPPPRKLQTEKIYAFTETTAVESQPTFEEDRPKPGKLVGKWQPEESTVEKAIIKPGKLTNIEFIETEPEEKEVVKQQPPPRKLQTEKIYAFTETTAVESQPTFEEDRPKPGKLVGKWQPEESTVEKAIIKPGKLTNIEFIETEPEEKEVVKQQPPPRKLQTEKIYAFTETTAVESQPTFEEDRPKPGKLVGTWQPEESTVERAIIKPGKLTNIEFKETEPDGKKVVKQQPPPRKLQTEKIYAFTETTAVESQPTFEEDRPKPGKLVGKWQPEESTVEKAIIKPGKLTNIEFIETEPEEKEVVKQQPPPRKLQTEKIYAFTETTAVESQPTFEEDRRKPGKLVGKWQPEESTVEKSIIKPGKLTNIEFKETEPVEKQVLKQQPPPRKLQTEKIYAFTETTAVESQPTFEEDRPKPGKLVGKWQPEESTVEKAIIKPGKLTNIEFIETEPEEKEVVKQQPPPRKLQTEKIYAFTETTAVESQPTFEEDRRKPGKLVGKWQPEESTVEKSIIKPGKLTNIEFKETEPVEKQVLKQQPPPRKLQTEKIYAFTETTAVEAQPTFEEDRPKPGKLVGKWQPEESTVERAIIKPGKLTNIEFGETEPDEKEVVKQQPPPRKLQTEKIYAFTETTAVESQPTFEEDRPKPGKLVGKWQPEESTVERAIIKPGKLTNIEFKETEPDGKEVVKQQPPPRKLQTEKIYAFTETTAVESQPTFEEDRPKPGKLVGKWQPEESTVEKAIIKPGKLTNIEFIETEPEEKEVVKQQPPPRKLQTEKIYAFTETTAVESQPTFEEDRPKPGKLVGKWQPEESTVERTSIKPGKLTKIEFDHTEPEEKEVVRQQPLPRKLETEKIIGFTETTAVKSQSTFEEDRLKPGKLVGKWQPEESTVGKAIIKPGKLTNIEFKETQPEEKDIAKQQSSRTKLQTEKKYPFIVSMAPESQSRSQVERQAPGKLGQWQPVRNASTNVFQGQKTFVGNDRAQMAGFFYSDETDWKSRNSLESHVQLRSPKQEQEKTEEGSRYTPGDLTGYQYKTKDRSNENKRWTQQQPSLGEPVSKEESMKQWSQPVQLAGYERSGNDVKVYHNVSEDKQGDVTVVTKTKRVVTNNTRYEIKNDHEPETITTVRVERPKIQLHGVKQQRIADKPYGSVVISVGEDINSGIKTTQQQYQQQSWQTNTKPQIKEFKIVNEKKSNQTRNGVEIQPESIMNATYMTVQSAPSQQSGQGQALGQQEHYVGGKKTFQIAIDTQDGMPPKVVQQGRGQQLEGRIVTASSQPREGVHLNQRHAQMKEIAYQQHTAMTSMPHHREMKVIQTSVKTSKQQAGTSGEKEKNGLIQGVTSTQGSQMNGHWQMTSSQAIATSKSLQQPSSIQIDLSNNNKAQEGNKQITQKGFSYVAGPQILTHQSVISRETRVVKEGDPEYEALMMQAQSQWSMQGQHDKVTTTKKPIEKRVSLGANSQNAPQRMQIVHELRGKKGELTSGKNRGVLIEYSGEATPSQKGQRGYQVTEVAQQVVVQKRK